MMMTKTTKMSFENMGPRIVACRARATGRPQGLRAENEVIAYSSGMLGITTRTAFVVLAASLVVACGSSGGTGGNGGVGGSGGSAGSGAEGGGGGSPEPAFEEFAWQTGTPDVRTERLCAEAAAPDDAPDTTFIDCDIEGATFSSEEPPAKDELVVLAYNILRGFDVDGQLDMITSGVDFPVPDVLLLSEVDRGCRRTDFRNIARDYAERLGYYYVYVTEFVELPSDRGDTGPYDPPICEHGNALVSRYPLGNVRQIRHAENISWYTPPGAPDPDEPRLGGRIAIAADAKIGSALVRLYVLHLESTLSAVTIRDAQAEEIAADGEGVSYPVIAGGDLNTFFYYDSIDKGILTEPAVESFVDRGHQDAHDGIPLEERYTSFDPFDMILDIILPRGVEVTNAGRCPPERCGSLSDHLPVFAEVRGVLGQ
jgi:endonuclease/exonuclease/phosphatase family metal-dependent hydrolase